MPEREMIDSLMNFWDRVRNGLLTTLDLLMDEEFDIVTYPDGRTARQIALHIAQEELGEFAYGITRTLEDFPPDYSLAEYPDHEAIKRLLAEVHDPVRDYFAEATDADLLKTIRTPWGAELSLLEMLLHILEHEIHHRGELSLALGLLGRQGLDA